MAEVEGLIGKVKLEHMKVFHLFLLLKRVNGRGRISTELGEGGRFLRQKNIRTEGLISTECEEVGRLEFIENLDIKLRIFWFVDGKFECFRVESVPDVGQFLGG